VIGLAGPVFYIRGGARISLACWAMARSSARWRSLFQPARQTTSSADSALHSLLDEASLGGALTPLLGRSSAAATVRHSVLISKGRACEPAVHSAALATPHNRRTKRLTSLPRPRPTPRRRGDGREPLSPNLTPRVASIVANQGGWLQNFGRLYRKTRLSSPMRPSPGNRRIGEDH
jgi:hypothetical protein